MWSILMDYTKLNFGKVVKMCFATFALLLPFLLCFAQQPTIFSLKREVQKSGTDSSRIKALLQIGEYYLSKNNPDSAQNYAAKAEKLSLSINNAKELGNCYVLSGRAFGFRKDKTSCYARLQKAIDLFINNKMYQDAAEAALKMDEQCNALDGANLELRIAWHKKAADLYHLAGIKEREAFVLKEMGDLMQLEGKSVEALVPLKQALAIYRSINYPYLQGIYDLIGNVCTEAGNYAEGMKYGLLAVKTAETVKDTTMQLCTIYNRLGLTYYFNKQFELSERYFVKSLAIAKRYKDAGAITLVAANLVNNYIKLGKYQKAIENLKYIDRFYPPKTVDDRALLDGLFLVAYSSLKQYQEAKPYCDKLLTESKKINRQSEYQRNIQYDIAFFYVTFNEGAEARKHLENYRTISIALNNLNEQAKSYLLECKLDSAEKKFPAAIEAYRQYTLLKDSLFNAKKSGEIAQLEIQYQTEKKDKELQVKQQNIQLLTKQTQFQKANLAQKRVTRNLIITGAVLVALLLALSYNRLRLKQTINKRLQIKQNEISQKNRTLTTLVQEKDNLLEEKEWLMKEIHHRVKNNLQIVISLLNTQSAYVTNDIAFNAIRDSQHRMQSISLIHQKLYRSESRALIEANSYIAELINYLSSSFDTGKRICFKKNLADLELDVSRAVPIGLILNEAITNSIKYAFPNNADGCISVSLSHVEENSFRLNVSDNGIGLPEDFEITQCRSLGMNLMHGLSKQIGSSLKLESNKGLSISIDFKDDSLLKPGLN